MQVPKNMLAGMSPAAMLETDPRRDAWIRND